MDWRNLSRSRSRAPFRLSMPSSFHTDFDFGAAIAEASPPDATASPGVYGQFDLPAGLAGVDASQGDQAAATAGAGVNDEAIRRLYNRTAGVVDPTSHLDPFASFDFGSLGLPMGPSQSTLLGSVPGLTEDHARIANAHAEYGSLPRLVRKTSYDSALLQSVLGKNLAGKKDGRATEPASPQLGQQSSRLGRPGSDKVGFHISAVFNR